MDIETTSLPEVKILTPRRFGDTRGFFSESWNRARMAEAGLDYDFVQDNESLSEPVHTLRGLHYQAPPMAQAKLVRVARGRILDVAVDVRSGSPRYGRHCAVELSAENGRQLMVPRGFLHGFLTLEPECHVLYKADNYFAPEADGSVIWNDPDLGIDWGTHHAELSGKDAVAPLFRDWTSPFQFGEGS